MKITPNYISKELAEWLHAHGCNIGTEYFWTNVVLGFVDMDFNRPVFDEKGFVVKHESELHTECPVAIPAYTWFDLLVTHANRFWGTKNSENVAHLYDAGSCVLDASDNALLNVGILLRLGDFRIAEDYVRRFSLFNKKISTKKHL